MKEETVGKIKNFSYNSEDDVLEVTITIINKKYQKKFLRDLFLSGHVKMVGDKLVYVDTEDEEEG